MTKPKDMFTSSVTQAGFFHKISKKFGSSSTNRVQPDIGSLSSGDDGSTGAVVAGGRVEMLISCMDLIEMDAFSKSDPMCVLFVRQFGQWKEYARTEAVENATNPKFTESFILDFNPEKIQHIKFAVYDIDCRSMDLRKHDFVGSVETTLMSLFNSDTAISNTNYSLRVPGDPKVRGYINISLEYVREVRSKAHFQVGGSNLDKKGLFSLAKSNTFLEVSRSVNSVDFHPVYRSEVIFKSQNPRWKQFDLSVQKICNGDLQRQIQFAVWHYEKNGNHVLIGESITSLTDMQKYRGKSCLSLPVLEPKKLSKKKNYTDSGSLKVLLFRLDMQYSLLDYVSGGCMIKFTIAIDFTASNGSKAKNSLHSTEGDNIYIDVIRSVGAMLAHYDLSEDFPAYGFGAKFLSNKKKVEHCFPLNGDHQKPAVTGIQGLVESYRNIIPKLKLAGPTYFSPVLKEVMKSIGQGQPSQSDQFYNILLIITDGIVNDLDQTVNDIIEASHLPLSIFIVGVGPADFSMMDEFIAAPDHLLKSHTSNEIAKRNNVHFSAFPSYANSNSYQINTTIAKEALGTVSSQIVSYLKNKAIVPNRKTVKLPKADPVHASNNNQQCYVPKEVNPAGSGHRISTLYTGPLCPTCGASIDDR